MSIPPPLPCLAEIPAAPLVEMAVGLPPPTSDLDRLAAPKAIDKGNAESIRTEFSNTRIQSEEPVSAIQRAIEGDQVDTLCLLLDEGMYVDHGDIQAAVTRGRIPMVDRLLQHVSLPIDTVFENGHTLLSLAVDHENTVAWLLSKGADPNIQDGWSETPLSRAVESGPESVIAMLLDAGADITLGAPIHMALLRREKTKTAGLDLVKKLLALGAPVDKFIGEDSRMWEWAGFERGTALSYASIRGDVEIVRLLLAHGADPLRNQRLYSYEIPNTSPLDKARREGHTDVIWALETHLGMERQAKANM